MRRPILTLAVATLIPIGALSLGCSDSATGPAATQRVARQEQIRTADGALLSYWIYSYDASGYLAEVRSYDAATGRRTGATVRDADDVVIATSSRTYAQGLWTEAQVDYVSGGESVIRRFTYERGAVAIEDDIFMEF